MNPDCSKRTTPANQPTSLAEPFTIRPSITRDVAVAPQPGADFPRAAGEEPVVEAVEAVLVLEDR